MVMPMQLVGASARAAAPASSETTRFADAASVIREPAFGADNSITESIWD
jgi:hypothetical protein